jgi:HEAT repeat protein
MRKSCLVSVLAVFGLFAAAIVFLRMQIELPSDREAIADHLQELGAQVRRNPTDRRALDELKEILNRGSSFARTYACGVLRDLGPLATSAIPDLIRALNCGDGYVEREAALALGTVAVGDARPVPALIEKLKQEDDDAAWFSADALGNIGEPALPAIPALERALNSKWDLMASSARHALEKLYKIRAEKHAE